MKKQKIYVITNCTGEDNYTPSVFKDRNEALSWMRECATNNIVAGYKKELKSCIYDEAHNPVTDDAERLQDIILDYADTYIDGVDVFEEKISIYYDDETCNILELFEVEMIETMEYAEDYLKDVSISHLIADSYAGYKVSDFKPGDTVYTANYSFNAQERQVEQIIGEHRVKTVGKKYVTIENGHRFYAIENKSNTYLLEDSTWGNRDYLFKSKVHADEFFEKKGLVIWFSGIQRSMDEYSLDQLKKVREILEGKRNLGTELAAQFKNASEQQVDELDFFIELIEQGITLDDIKKHLPEKYEYSKRFMEEHGLC